MLLDLALLYMEFDDSSKKIFGDITPSITQLNKAFDSYMLYIDDAQLRQEYVNHKYKYGITETVNKIRAEAQSFERYINDNIREPQWYY